jgi:hypothetical protein
VVGVVGAASFVAGVEQAVRGTPDAE